jgi:hypothetical protein
MSTGNPDIRGEIAENRGSIKKLEMLIPGLRTYRKLDDIRVADDLLRHQVADKLDSARANLELARKQMAAAGDFNGLTSLGSLIFELQQVSGQVRYAEQGYTGIAASFSMNDDKLNKLYDYDYAFVQAAVDLQNATSPSKLVYDPTQAAAIQSAISSLNSLLTDFKQKWSARIEYVQGILLK